jgi:hypothetical protein
MENESTFPVLRRFWRPRAFTIQRCPVHGICKPVANKPGKCPHPRCVKTLQASTLTKLVLG